MANPVPPTNQDCPLCGGPNACAPARSGGFGERCWCEDASFSAELLARIPAALRSVACVCAACARANEDSPAAAR